ncbi:MAG TPA: response regulator transcription factor [Candidatus Ozemobacteraceae bacterium]|nr:response regulator transcription factor [Candidatus Ozemobacteraceae bacterium]
MINILIIDDDRELVDLLETYLGAEGLTVASRQTGNEGLEAARAGGIDLVILDVMLPNMNGFDVLKHLREHSQVPVIMLTARGEEVDRIVGFELGADDYLPKPFKPRELLARIRAVLRRVGGERHQGGGDEVLATGGVEMSVQSRSVRRDGKQLDLTEAEFLILEILLRSPGKVVPRQELAQKALGRHLSYDDRSLDVHLSHLRKKLGLRQNGGERIRTIRGTGYLYLLTHE